MDVAGRAGATTGLATERDQTLQRIGKDPSGKDIRVGVCVYVRPDCSSGAPRLAVGVSVRPRQSLHQESLISALRSAVTTDSLGAMEEISLRPRDRRPAPFSEQPQITRRKSASRRPDLHARNENRLPHREARGRGCDHDPAGDRMRLTEVKPNQSARAVKPNASSRIAVTYPHRYETNVD
jgi:hypothetical protein